MVGWGNYTFTVLYEVHSDNSSYTWWLLQWKIPGNVQLSDTVSVALGCHDHNCGMKVLNVSKKRVTDIFAYSSIGRL